LTKAGLYDYYIVIMLSCSQTSLPQQLATLFSVAEPLVVVSQNPLCEHVKTLRKRPILCELARIFDKNEPEQSVEKQWLTDSQKSEAEQLIENKGQRIRPDFYSKRT
jgi:hypothetical protein